MHGLELLQRFDGLDNRKVILDCFVRMGKNRSEDEAGSLRAGFLQGMSYVAASSFRGVLFEVEGLPTAQEAYALFLQIAAHLGRPVEQSVLLLEKAVKLMEGRYSETLRGLRP